MIEAEHLSKDYGDTRSMIDVSFNIPSIEVVGLL